VTATTTPDVQDAPLETGRAADRRLGGKIWFAQAIRGVAATLVVYERLTQDFLRHQDVVATVTTTPQLHGLPNAPLGSVTDFLESHNLAIGIFGVALFFITSGFVIPFSLERRSLRGFFIRRFFRLYPTLWVAMLLALIALRIHTRGQPFPYGFGEIAGSAFLVAPYFGKAWVDPVFYTLAIEELFYAIAAVMAWRGLLQSRLAVCGAGISLMGFVLIFGQIHAAEPNVSYARYWLAFNATFVIFIFVGVALHQWLRERWSAIDTAGVIVLLLGVFSLALYNGPFGKTGDGDPDVYITCAMTGLVIFGVLMLIRDRLPFWQPLNYLAEISYPLYAVHTVAGWIVLIHLYDRFDSYWIALAITTPLVFGGAALMHHLIEVPSNDLGRRLAEKFQPRRKTVTGAAAATTG
jgi:peptidoglycan/LPS O-acetylase OafA/YrhL